MAWDDRCSSSRDWRRGCRQAGQMDVVVVYICWKSYVRWVNKGKEDVVSVSLLVCP